MFKKAKNVISVIFSLIKFLIIKVFRFNGFYFQLIERFSPDTMINIWPKGKLVLGKKVRAHSGTRLSVTNNAILEIGDYATFNYNCIVAARKHIKIGRNVAFGPNVVIYDHDHDFRNTQYMNGDTFKVEDIIIGDNVWIGANAIILRGSVIGDNAVIAAGTVVRGKVEPNSVAYNKKELCYTKYDK